MNSKLVSVCVRLPVEVHGCVSDFARLVGSTPEDWYHDWILLELGAMLDDLGTLHFTKEQIIRRFQLQPHLNQDC